MKRMLGFCCCCAAAGMLAAIIAAMDSWSPTPRARAREDVRPSRLSREVLQCVAAPCKLADAVVILPLAGSRRVLTVGLAAALGLTAIITNPRWVYEALWWGGVFYLLWLAWEGWRGQDKTSPRNADLTGSRLEVFRARAGD